MRGTSHTLKSVEQQGKAVRAVGRHLADTEDKQHVDTRQRVSRLQRISTQQKPVGQRRADDVLFWGIFMAVTTAGAMMWADVDWRLTAAVASLLLMSFAAVWRSSPASARPVPTAEPAPTEPAPPQPEPTPAHPSPAHPTSAAPSTCKEMLAADHATGVLPVVSAVAGRPGPGSARRSGAEAAVPLAPAGQILQGIDTEKGKPESRKARRRAEAGNADRRQHSRSGR